MSKLQELWLILLRVDRNTVQIASADSDETVVRQSVDGVERRVLTAKLVYARFRPKATDSMGFTRIRRIPSNWTLT
jgi:hypothetical protein